MGDVASMTGFADATKTTASGAVTVEIRSVNGRFWSFPSAFRMRSGPPNR